MNNEHLTTNSKEQQTITNNEQQTKNNERHEHTAKNKQKQQTTDELQIRFEELPGNRSPRGKPCDSRS